MHEQSLLAACLPVASTQHGRVSPAHAQHITLLDSAGGLIADSDKPCRFNDCFKVLQHLVLLECGKHRSYSAATHIWAKSLSTAPQKLPKPILTFSCLHSMGNKSTQAWLHCAWQMQGMSMQCFTSRDGTHFSIFRAWRRLVPAEISCSLFTVSS